MKAVIIKRHLEKPLSQTEPPSSSNGALQRYNIILNVSVTVLRYAYED